MLFSKHQFVFGALFTLLCSTPRIYAQDSLADTIERAEKSVIRIEVSGRDGESLGSGFVIDNRGTFITNCHVLAGASSARAVFPNGREAGVTGTLLIDESRDIVVGRISVTDAPAIPMASSLPRKGDRVTALGSPHGLSFTATTGIVSAIRTQAEMSRDLGRQSIQGTWIQVDAAISPGNSGGPLINAKGEVVAMSTLASSGSRAQNLNFGVSAEDISKAIRFASRQPLKTLSEGVGRIEMEESESGGPGGEGAPPPIPPKAFEQYIADGQSQFKELQRGIRTEISRLNENLKQMRSGQPYIPSSVLQDPKYRDASVVRVQIPGMRNLKWFFRSKRIQDDTIERQQQKIRKMNQVRSGVRESGAASDLSSLLWNYGPSERKRKGDIAFFNDILVLEAIDGNRAIAVVEDNLNLIWMESTAGISSGEILSGPAFVAGTATLRRSDGSLVITLLQLIDEDQLNREVASHLGQAPSMASQTKSADGFRTWHDKSGKFSVDAILIGSDSSSVVLKKRDGQLLTVPLSKLSEADRRHLNK